jgi:hypothetical protein
MNRVIAIVVAIIVVLVAYRAIHQKMEQSRTQPSAQVESVAAQLEVDATFDTFADSIRKGADLPACQGMLQQVNAYLGSHPGDRPAQLGQEQRGFLQARYALDESELAEVDNGNFTSLDAHYLELVLLLRDVIGSLRVAELPPLEGATRTFDWVVRQVGLQPPQGDAYPPQFVLRRGFGTALERAFVFMALLDQLGIDNCMLVLPETGSGGSGTRYWIPAVLLKEELYLFDTRLGFPIPGPQGKGVATLKQIQAHPELLGALTVDDKFPYDVKPTDAARARLEVACPISPMSPRMRYLQDKLAANEKVALFVDPVARLQRFDAALKRSGLPAATAKGWNHPGDKNNPIQVLRSFLPTQEGGTDTSHRRDEAIAQLVPWLFLPAVVKQLPGEPGVLLQQMFASPFRYFYTQQRMPREMLEAWLPGLVEASAHGDTPGKTSELILRERMPRDLVLRGKFDEATTLLVAIRDELTRQRSQPLDPSAIQEWLRHAVEVAAGMVQAQKAKQGADPAAVANAKRARDMLWEAKRSEPVRRLVQVAAAEPMLGEVNYLLALCKQEQADRVQAELGRGRGDRPASAHQADSKSVRMWKAAASWWETYLDQPGIPPARASAARFLQAQTRAMLDQCDAAADLLRTLPDNLMSLEKTGRLYLAKHGCPR